MKALVYDGKLHLKRNYPDPRPPKGEVLVDVICAGVCSTDLEIVRGYMNFRGVLGHEFVGRIASGPRNQQGQRVVGEINCACGKCDMCQSGLSAHCRNRTVLGIQGRDGAFAEKLCLPERNLHRVPDSISDEQAVFVEPLAAAIQVVKQVPIEKRDRVIVLGDGRLGLLVAQVLATTGCKLTVVGKHPDKLAFCDKRGIQTLLLTDQIPKRQASVVVDCTGSPSGLPLACTLVRPRGTIVLKTTTTEKYNASLSSVVADELTIVGSRCGPFGEAISMLARREVEVESLITRRFKLDRAVAALEAAASDRQIKVLIQIGK